MHLRKQATQPSDLSYRLIPLTQGQFAIVDESDYTYLSQFKWQAHWNPDTRCFRAQRTAKGDVKPKTILMHREIMRAQPGFDVDHQDHNELNNRRLNLRVATRHQNNCNKRRLKPGLKGVHHRKRNSKRPYEAYMGTGGKIYLGCYATAEEAHEAYKKASREAYGEFACAG